MIGLARARGLPLLSLLLEGGAGKRYALHPMLCALFYLNPRSDGPEEPPCEPPFLLEVSSTMTAIPSLRFPETASLYVPLVIPRTTEIGFGLPSGERTHTLPVSFPSSCEDFCAPAQFLSL
jgi:hypothetical protein